MSKPDSQRHDDPYWLLKANLRLIQIQLRPYFGQQNWRAAKIIVVPILVALIYAARVSLYPMNLIVILKVIAYGIMPTILALAGDHLAAEVEKDVTKKRIYRAFFFVCAVSGVFLIAIAENKADRDHSQEARGHSQEVQGLTGKIESANETNTKILRQLTGEDKDPSSKEVLRRNSLVSLLRNEWILTHKNVTTEMLVGTENPPADWVNARLKELGESFTVSSPVQTLSQVQPAAYGNIRERCLKLSSELENLSKHRNAKFEDPVAYPRPLTQERVNEWLRSNDIRMQPYLPRIIALRDELAQMHFHDEILDGFLKDHQRNLDIKRNDPEFADYFVWLKVEDMDTVVECFRRLANQIPQ